MPRGNDLEPAPQFVLTPFVKRLFDRWMAISR
jgi:hypothetical protein